MQDTNDGFVISEKDLELRGTGDFFGTKQHGLPEFKIANLFEDIDILKQVQSVANKITKQDPNLEKKENEKPSVIIAHTIKGKSVSFMENDCGWHGKCPSPEQLTSALEELEV